VTRLKSLLGIPDGDTLRPQPRCRREALVAGAQIYVNFLSLTRRSGWLQAHISTRDKDPHISTQEKAESARKALLTAAHRHLAFMELRKDFPAAVPTRDISVMWSADLLHPQKGAIRDHEEAAATPTAWFDHQQHRLLQSGAIFERVTGKRWSMFNAAVGAGFGGLWQSAIPSIVSGLGPLGLLGPMAGAYVGGKLWGESEEGTKATPAVQRFDVDASGIITAEERAKVLAEWEKAYKETASLWLEATGTDYRITPEQYVRGQPLWQRALRSPDEIEKLLAKAADPEKRKRDAEALVDAVVSQASFVGRILALGPKVINEAYIDRAVDRYARPSSGLAT